MRVNRIEHAKKNALETLPSMVPPLTLLGSPTVRDGISLEMGDVKHSHQCKRPQDRSQKAPDVLAERAPRRLISGQRGSEILFVESKQEDPCSQGRDNRYGSEQSKSVSSPV
jgi:hypothetical protein